MAQKEKAAKAKEKRKREKTGKDDTCFMNDEDNTALKKQKKVSRCAHSRYILVVNVGSMLERRP